MGLLFQIDADDVREYAREIDAQVQSMDADLRSILGPAYDVVRLTPGYTIPHTDPATSWLDDWLAYRRSWQAYVDGVLVVFGPATWDTLATWNAALDYERQLRDLHRRLVAIGYHPTTPEPTVGPVSPPTSGWDRIVHLGMIATGIAALYFGASYLRRK
jgi:hypothetical protein